jgi:ABC-type antimicrobial peptide transport system permease subunit
MSSACVRCAPNRFSPDPVAVGLGIGLAGSVAISRYLQQLLFGVTLFDATTFASVSAGFVLVALAASWTPAYRATGMNPLSALRSQ